MKLRLEGHKINALIQGMQDLARASDENNQRLLARIEKLQKEVDVLKAEFAKRKVERVPVNEVIRP